MQVVKRRTFSGVVCEQEVYHLAEKTPYFNYKSKGEPRLRFKDEAERKQHRWEISRRNHARLFNENFSSSSLYGTLTFDDAHEIFTISEAKKIAGLYMRRLMGRLLRLAGAAVVVILLSLNMVLIRLIKRCRT